MMVAGAGWVEAGAYGAVYKQLRGEYGKPRELHRSLETAGVLGGKIQNIGRFDIPTRRAFCAAALALHDAEFSSDEKAVGLIGTGSEECIKANRNYLADYPAYGLRMGRANLFIYTLPTSPLAEIAIHFKLAGPLFYTRPLSDIYAHLLNTAKGLMAAGNTSAVLALWMEDEFTTALLLKAGGSGLCSTQEIPVLKNPEQLIKYLEEKR